jgi:predicted DNA-binding WGR domain protein
MDNLFTLAFEAHNREQNHHRHYAVTLGHDMLKDWTVAIRYGRTGQTGRELRYAAAEPAAMKAIIRDRLQRRLSAPKRIGCAYQLSSYSAAPALTPPPGCRVMPWHGSSPSISTPKPPPRPPRSIPAPPARGRRSGNTCGAHPWRHLL